MKDRIHLLKIEQELISLIKDENRTTYRFPAMSSYHRMLVHRVAAYFGFEHNIDPKGNCVIVDKQDGITRIPELRFKDQIKQLSAEEPKKLILKRNTNSFEDGSMGDRGDLKSSGNGLDARRAKSFEERNEHYEKVKARIFNQSNPKSDTQLGNIEESDSKCNSTEPNYNNGFVNDSAKSNDSLRNFNFNSNHHHFDSGHSSYFNNHHVGGYPKPNYEDNHHLNEHSDYQFNQHNSHFNVHHHLNSTGDLVDNASKFYKSNGYKGKLLKNNNSKNTSKQQQQPPPPPHFYQPNLPPQMLNPLDQQQLYSTNWLPADLNAQQAADCFAKPIYQPLHYNQLTHPNQQKLFLLCNYPGEFALASMMHVRSLI